MSELDINIFRVNNHLCHFSADGKFFAIAFQTSLLIKNTTNFDTLQSFVFTDMIENLKWSPNSEFIFCANIKKNVIQVYSIYYPQWKCKLVEGSAGLESVHWSPDSKHILTFSDYFIQISAWSLETQCVSYIQNLKSSYNKLNFNPVNNKLAVIATHEGQDSVEIYRSHNWKLSQKLLCERLNSIDGILWSPCGELLCIWCSISGDPKLIIYSIKLEQNLALFCPAKSTNNFITVSNYGKELIGIETVTWISSGQLLAITGFNEMIVLLNHVTWNIISQLYLDPVIRENNYLNKVYKECVVQANISNKNTISCKSHILKEQHERPINIRIGKKDSIDKFSFAKTDIIKFSTCGIYLAIKHELYPTTLWIWNIITDCLDYLLLENSIVSIKWNPKCAQLLVLCECAHMFLWTPNSAICIPTPKNITVLNARWYPQGKLIALCGYNKVVVYNTKNEF